MMVYRLWCPSDSLVGDTPIMAGFLVGHKPGGGYNSYAYEHGG